MSNYIVERNTNLYYRRRIPKEFANFFPQNYEIRIPFRKISRIQAILKSKKINMLFEELLMALQLDTFDKKEAIVNEYMAMMRDSLREGYYGSNYSTKISKTALQFEQLQCEHSLQTNISHIASSQIVDVFYQAGIDMDEVDRNTYKQVEKLYLHKKIDMLQEFIHSIDPKKDFAHNPSLNAETVKDTGITFKNLYELFIKEKRKKFPDTSPTSWREYKSAYNDFIYVIGDVEDRDIARFTKDDFRVFEDALHERIPSSRTKKAQYRDLPYSKLKEIELDPSEKMATNTKKKKISMIKQMFDIAIDPRYDYLTVNYAQPFLIKEQKGKKNNVIDRKPLSNENLQKFFSTKFYTTKLEHTLSHAPEKYWIPIIAAFTGMRQNEICQLHIDDLKQEIVDGNTVWYFDINDNGNKHLKNENAIRFMPLHPKLIELGFIDYYDSIKEKHDRIWPNLRLHPQQERYNSDYNKTFMKFFRRYVTTDESQVFHSFRHNVGDQLIKNTVRDKLPKALVNRLMGHEPDKDMTSLVYSQGYGVKELYEGIRTLDFEDLIG
jgi:integrase